MRVPVKSSNDAFCSTVRVPQRTVSPSMHAARRAVTGRAKRHAHLWQVGRALLFLQPFKAFGQNARPLCKLSLLLGGFALVQARFAVAHTLWSLAHRARLFTSAVNLLLETAFFRAVLFIFKLLEGAFPVPLREIVGVSAGIDAQPAVFNCPDGCAEPVEQRAVVGNEHNCTAAVQQQLLKLFDSIEIQVCCRFIGE